MDAVHQFAVAKRTKPDYHSSYHGSDDKGHTIWKAVLTIPGIDGEWIGFASSCKLARREAADKCCDELINNNNEHQQQH